MQEYQAVALYLGVVALVVLAITGMIGRMRAGRRTGQKRVPYECGVASEPGVAPRFPVRFYLVAMLFVILDVEAVAFYPWGVRLRELGAPGLVDMAVFAVVLAIGYAYVWKKGGLDWR
jgi:NADH-quinone oxidoreductase subunit A